MKILYYITAFFLLLQTQSYSQNNDKATSDKAAISNKAIKEADKKFDAFAYVDAREVYLDVAKSGYKSENLFKKLGDSYYLNNELSKSLEWYEKLYNFQKKIGAEYLFRYSMALKSVKRYDEANKVLQEYHLELDPNYDSNKQKIKTPQEQLIALNKDKFTIEKTTINSEFSDYSPAYYNSNLVFSSNRKDKEKAGQPTHNWNNQPFSDLYMVTLKKDNKLDDKIERFNDKINSPYHESSPVFTKDGKTMYFTRNNYTDNKFKASSKGVNLLKIYKSTKGEDDTWQEPVPLSFNSDEYSCAHPALSVDEKKLYFSSDMTGTLGMSDLFIVDIYSDGSYGTPANLGDQINTIGRESYPYISKKNQLFFSSDGYDGGLGGFDVFVTEIKDYTTVSEIINLGSPINSSTDDISFILDTNDNTGFFASNRNDGSGSDDIYGFKLSDNLISSCKQHISGYVTDELSKSGLNNVTVKLFDAELRLLQTTNTNNIGAYKFEVDCNKQYIIRTYQDDFQTTEKTFFADSEHEKNINVNFPIQQGNLLGKSKAKYGDDLGKTLQLDPIYFDFDQSNIRPDAEVELQKIIAFLKRNKDIKVDIRSHTDSYGERAYNLRLSEHRAISTIDYIVKNGIAKSRLKGKGYGDTKLVNNCVHGVICSEEEHQLNRRSEFILLGNNEENVEMNTTTTEKPKEIIKTEPKVETKIINTVQPTIELPSKKDITTTSIPAKTDNLIKSEIIVQPIATSIDSIPTKTDNIIKSEIIVQPIIENATTEIKYNIPSSNNTKKEYDFTSLEEIYTVQIGALSNPTSDTYVYDGVTVFNHKYPDGFVRFFSGVFDNVAEAQAYKLELLNKKGLTGVFVIRLKGDKRISN